MSRWVNDRFELIANRYGIDRRFAALALATHHRGAVLHASDYAAVSVLCRVGVIEDQSAINLVVDSPRVIDWRNPAGL